MNRTTLAFVLASTCVAACSQPAPPQSAATGAVPAQAAPETAAVPGQAQAPPPAAAATTPPPQAVATPPAQAAPVTAAPVPVQAPPPPAEPPPPPAPTFREVTIPAGTTLRVTLLSPLASDTSHVEDLVKGSIAKSVVVGGATALRVGTQLTGSVTSAEESGRVKGRAEIAFRFDHMVIDDEPVRIQTAPVHREAAADTKSDVKKGGLGAGLGAIVGGVIGGGKGAAIGAVAGGAGTVMATKGEEVEIPAGTAISVLLQNPLTVTVPIK